MISEGGSTNNNKFARAVKPQEDPLAKALKVKTGTLRRNIKDLDFAKAEVKREEARLEKVKQEDPDKVSQQENVIGESRMMVPLSENRIRAALSELQQFLQDNSASLEAAATAEALQVASVTIDDANKALSPA